jgi:3-deoxy-D-manno-octulosonate 8-phosphate phosphatase (KDO 8-P phosphatase)
MSNFKEDLMKVKAFVFDVDGVFTDNLLYCFANGEQIRSFNAKDGFAVRFAQKQGFPIGIISAGRENEGTIKRLQYLDITDLYMGTFKKAEAMDLFVKKHQLNLENVLYMGDDIPDFPVLKMVGIPTCPADAAVEVKHISKYVSSLPGGSGCVRDVIEQVLRAQGKWVNLDIEKPDIL